MFKAQELASVCSRPPPASRTASAWTVGGPRRVAAATLQSSRPRGPHRAQSHTAASRFIQNPDCGSLRSRRRQAPAVAVWRCSMQGRQPTIGCLVSSSHRRGSGLHSKKTTIRRFADSRSPSVGMQSSRLTQPLQPPWPARQRFNEMCLGVAFKILRLRACFCLAVGLCDSACACVCVCCVCVLRVCVVCVVCCVCGVCMCALCVCVLHVCLCCVCCVWCVVCCVLCVVLRSVVLCCAVLCCAVLCCVLLCCLVVLCLCICLLVCLFAFVHLFVY